MGEIADLMINGEFDFYTGEYLDGESPGYPRVYKAGRIQPVHGPEDPNTMRVKAISKELKALILKKQSTCTTDKRRNHAVNQARAEINKKYGHGWRGF